MSGVGGPSAPGLAYDPSKHQYHPAPSGDVYRDPESLEETPLVPGMSPTENSLRWGFINKVFGIVGCQLGLTAVMAAIIMFNAPVQNFVLGNVAVQIVFALLPFLVMIPLFIYRNKHPVNLALLGAFTLCLSVSVGAACSIYAPEVVLEAVALTAAIVGGLTAYSFYATRKGKDFTFMGPMLFSALWGMVIWGFIQVFFRPGPVGQTIYALLGSFLFSAYIVYDVHLLIARLSLDDYIWASVTLYLDIINLFLYILQLLGRSQRN
jgi:FtsH-binding integral membrane protein